jgi:hypothetical protein
MTILESILLKDGPMMSSDLSQKLEELESIPKNTASQKVSRCKEIEKIKGFYSSNQSFCFLKDHEKDGLFYEKFISSLYDHGKKYWFSVNALKMHGGILSRRYLECYTNYPIIPLKKHVPFNKVIQKFVEQGILQYNGDKYYLSPKFSINRSSIVTYNTIELIKENILNAFGTLSKNIGLISFKTGESFAEYGKFRWGFKGVSTVSGLMNESTPGFLLADILIGSSIYEDDVRFFIEKIKHIQSFKNSPRLLPFLIVDSIDKKGLILLKKHGVIVAIIGELFGQKYAETLKELITILNNAGASLRETPEKYLDLISQLKRYNEGLANNIRGTLFEYMVGHVHSVKCQSIDLGREIFELESRHEIDVLAIYSDKIVIAECKATKSKIDSYAVDIWIDIKIPAFKLWVDKQETYKKKILEFEYWSTGGFTDAALARLNRFSQSAKKFKVSYLQDDEIREQARVMDNKKLKDTLENFFLKLDI